MNSGSEVRSLPEFIQSNQSFIFFNCDIIAMIWPLSAGLLMMFVLEDDDEFSPISVESSLTSNLPSRDFSMN